MKMKVSDRILMALYAFIGAIVLTVSGVCTVAPDLAELLGLAVHNGLENWIALQILLLLLIIVLLACSVRLMMLAVRREGSAPSSSAAVQESVNGAVRVSVRAMETLVRRAVSQTDGVLDSKIRINNHDDSVTVEADLVVGIEAHVPAVTALLQRNVKGIVEEFSGIAVREVVVLVTEIRDNAPPALPAPKDESAQTVVVVPEAVEVKTEAAEQTDGPVEAAEPAEETAEEAPQAAFEAVGTPAEEAQNNSEPAKTESEEAAAEA